MKFITTWKRFQFIHSTNLLKHSTQIFQWFSSFFLVDAFFYPSNITCYCNNKSSIGNKHRECKNNRCSSQHALTDCYVMKINKNTVEKGCTFRPICMAYAHKEIEFNKKIIHCCRSPLCNEHINGSDLFYFNGDTGNKIIIFFK